jgi:(1->4)-alpha-D-glucan 1-alpha-D-glucosylmutase
MLATSTHDSKRSEDVRARINVLSEMPSEWRLKMRDWRRFNRSHKQVANDKPAPSPNDEYLLYQTLVGAWPFELSTADYDENEAKAFRERMEKYMLKAIREAKRSTSWINQNKEYESAVSSFVQTLLTPGPKNRFLDDFVPFQRRVARIGLWNSLSQTLLKLTAPGVPDIYQGNELWDLSLVDPDNRRPVDYKRRQQMFGSLRGIGDASDASSISGLLQTPEDGRLKLYSIWRTLCLRQEQPDLFNKGEYLTVTIEGAKADHVVAFARRSGTSSMLVVAPRLVATLLGGSDSPPIGQQLWGDTRLLLPFRGSGTRYRNALTRRILDLDATISVASLLAEFPVAIFVSA